MSINIGDYGDEENVLHRPYGRRRTGRARMQHDIGELHTSASKAVRTERGRPGCRSGGLVLGVTRE